MTTSVRVDADDLAWAPAHVVLDHISLEVPAGSLCALLGPNGGGKTTTLRCLAHLLQPDQGAVYYDGQLHHTLGTRQLGALRAFVSQDQPNELEFTVLDVVLIGRTPHKQRFDPDSAHDHDIAHQSLARVDLTGYEHRTLPTLSGGERQRTFIARAYAQQTPLLLLDEPTNHLDLRHQHKLLSQLRDQPATAIVSLHDPQLAATYADHIIVIHQGRVAAAGPPATTLTAELLHDVWGVDATVTRRADGRIRIEIEGIADD
ncbi:MAG: ABC transporter ATP-binding protein [Acidimicrobiales bacterium]|nr:ABC transporter ATP-binding protein [Acidimicrobiales bacterium]